MPETGENWPSFIKSRFLFAHQTHEIGQVLPYQVDFKAPGERKYLVNVMLFTTKDL